MNIVELLASFLETIAEKEGEEDGLTAQDHAMYGLELLEQWNGCIDCVYCWEHEEWELCTDCEAAGEEEEGDHVCDECLKIRQENSN